MPVTPEKWKLYAGIGLVLWAAGLQVGVISVAGLLVPQNVSSLKDKAHIAAMPQSRAYQ